MRLSNCAAAATVLAFLSLPAAAAETDWPKVAAALGKSGSEMPSGVYRVGLPRTDLHVTLDGVEIKPTLALGSWLAFRPEGNDAMVMGDLVLSDFTCTDRYHPVRMMGVIGLQLSHRFRWSGSC